MKVVVTGGSGFLGINLEKVMLGTGHTFISYDYKDGYDIRDRKQFSEFLNKHKPDACIHLAAIANLNIYDEDLSKGNDVNVVGSKIIIDECVERGVRVIFASTCCCYGNNKLLRSTEESVVAPTEPYSQSKRATEMYILELNKTLPAEQKVIITRLATFYGSAWCRRALATSLFIDLIHNEEKIEIHGSGTQTRTYTHVYDMCTGFVALVDNLKSLKHEIYNITNDAPVSVMDIVREAQINVGKPARIVFGDDRSSQFDQQVIVNDRLKELGWFPKFQFKAGMVELYSAYVSNSHKWLL